MEHVSIAKLFIADVRDLVVDEEFKSMDLIISFTIEIFTRFIPGL